MKTGEWPFILDRLITTKLPGVGTFLLNTSGITGNDGTDAEALTRGASFVVARCRTRLR